MGIYIEGQVIKERKVIIVHYLKKFEFFTDLINLIIFYIMYNVKPIDKY